MDNLKRNNIATLLDSSLVECDEYKKAVGLKNMYGKKAEYWPLYKNLARYFGIEEALLLVELWGKQRYYERKNKLDPEGFFYHHRKFIEQALFLTPSRQRAITKKLVQSGVLEIKKSGTPAKNYYRVDEDILQSICDRLPQQLYRLWKGKNKESIEKKLKGKRYAAPKKGQLSGLAPNGRTLCFPDLALELERIKNMTSKEQQRRSWLKLALCCVERASDVLRHRTLIINTSINNKRIKNKP